MSDSEKRYSRVEREILEILDEMESKSEKSRPGNVVDFRRPARPRAPNLPRPSLPGSLLVVTPARLLLATVLLAIAAVLVQGYSGTLATVFVLGAVVSFFAMFFVRSGSRGASVSSGPQTKRWRGRDIDLAPGSSRGSTRDWRMPWKRNKK